MKRDQTHTVCKLLRSAVFVILGLGAGAPALAQSSTVSETKNGAIILEEIIVTARAREQILQGVPLAISVLSSEDLDVRGISDVQNLADFTPNLEISNATGRRETSFTVRGLGSSTVDEKYQPVGFFVDGVWFGGQIGALSTADVERIEVIKGPHSTFGRATYGASIDYVTKTPLLDEFSGNVKGQFSDMETGVDSNHEVSANFSGPIVPGKVSASLFAQTKFDSGVAPALGSGNGSVGEQQSDSVSAVLFTQLSDRTSLKIRALYSQDSDTMINGYDSSPQYWVQQGSNIGTDAMGRAWIIGEVPDAIREGYYGGDITATHLRGQAENTFDRERTFVSAILEHEFENGIKIKYSGSFMKQDEDALFDGLAGTGVGVDPVLGPVAGLNTTFASAGFNNVIGEEWEENSHTVRVSSSDDQELVWSLGAYYYDSENANFTPNPAFFAFAPGNTTGLNRVEEITTVAAFGAVEYEISDRFSASFEARIQEEEVGRQGVPNALFSTQRIAAGGFSQKESSFQPRLSLSYTPNEDHNFYVTYSEGQKSGRYNLSRNRSVQATAVDGVFSEAAFTYVEPEELDNLEFGVKSYLFDGRALSSVAVFFQDIENQQNITSVIDAESATGLTTRLSNVGESDIFGFEADITYAINDRFTVQAAIGFNDHEFTSDVDAPNASDRNIFNIAGDAIGSETLRGRTYTNSSKQSAVLSGTYTVPTAFLGANEWSLRSDILYKGKKYVDAANLAYIPANARMNLRASLQGEKWVMSAFIDNVFDDETAYRGSSFPCTFTSVTDPSTVAALGLPAGSTNFASGQRCLSLVPSRSREIGVSLQFNF